MVNISKLVKESERENTLKFFRRMENSLFARLNKDPKVITSLNWTGKYSLTIIKDIRSYFSEFVERFNYANGKKADNTVYICGVSYKKSKDANSNHKDLTVLISEDALRKYLDLGKNKSLPTYEMACYDESVNSEFQSQESYSQQANLNQ